MAVCSCGRRADLRLGENGPPVCMPCYNTFQQNLQQTQALNMAFLNHLMDEMDFMAGLSPRGPRIRVPQPTYHTGTLNMNTTNNIRVEAGSQVGQINAGALNYLDRCVTILNDSSGGKALAAELQRFTQLVVDSQELSATAQKEILDYLKWIMEEVGKRDQRNVSMLRLALQNIGPLIKVAETAAAHWDKLKQLLEHLVR